MPGDEMGDDVAGSESGKRIMYRLQLLQADQWSLLDEREDEVFRGSLSECESWLDCQENQPPPSPRRFGFSEFNLRDWIHRIWTGGPVVPVQYQAPGSTSDTLNGGS